MNDDKAKTCKYSTGQIGQLAVYVLPTCPNMRIIRGKLVTTRQRCRKCKFYEEKNGTERKDN